MMDKEPKIANARRLKLDEAIALYRLGNMENWQACYNQAYPKYKAGSGSLKKEASKAFNLSYVQDKLKEDTLKVAKKADISQEQVIRELAHLALFDARKLFYSDGTPKPINELDDATAAAISGVKQMRNGDEWSTLEYKISDKNQALDKLMRHLGLYEKDNDQKTASLADALKSGIQRVKEMSE